MRTIATRTDYLDAGLAILADEGHGGLKIASLCSHFGVTTGSFYGYFSNFDAYVSALLQRWELEQTHRIVELSSVQSEPAERLGEMKRMALALPHEAEAAIRAWAHYRPGVAKAQRTVDAARETALYETVLGVVGNQATARALATFGLSLLVGIQQIRTPVPDGEIRTVLDEFELLVLSRGPSGVSEPPGPEGPS